MSALNLAQVLWDERQALAARPLHFPPAGTPGSTRHGHSAGTGDEEKRMAGIKSQEGAASRPEPEPQKIGEIYRRLNEDNRWAICLSGGGIRSAAFALGILQQFAAQQVASKRNGDKRCSALQQFEYLSTVSGGGYIGSWLSAWLFQERKNCERSKERFTSSATKTSNIQYLDANGVVAALNQRHTGVSDQNGREKDHEEVEAISNLLRDSHYLAPSFSAISPDLWSDIAGIVRNLCLNWILLLPPVFLTVLVTKGLSYAFIDAGDVTDASVLLISIMIAATACFATALSFSAANRPARGLINAPQPLFFVCDMALFLVGAALLIFVLGSPKGQENLSSVIRSAGLLWPDNFESKSFVGAVLFRGALLGLTIHFISWWAAPLWRKALDTQEQRPVGAKPWHTWFDLGTWCIAGAAFGALIAAGLLFLFHFYPPGESRSSDQITQMAALVATLGLPWIVSARIVAEVIFISFAEFIPGADAGLEYQARSSGIFTLAHVGWLIWFGLVLGAPLAAAWADDTVHGWVTASLGAAGGLSGAFAVIAGTSSKTTAIIRQASGLRQYFGINTLAAVAAGLFAVVLAAFVSIVISWGFTIDPFEHGPNHPSWTLVMVTAAVLAIVIGAASLVISINRYSLHSIYRNRLVRAFLAASRDEDERKETKNAFTDFDSRDSPLMHELWEHNIEPHGANWKPLHIINAALNLVSSKNLAWQERMAAPFTFSPLHCGSGSSIFPDGAYRTSYATEKGKPYGGSLGLTLGTAMAISGAAVSPNMGYNSSPGVAFLMALFNVRLGWWMSNPRGDNPHYWRTKPRIALRPFFMEMFGLTSENERWVYLSDGGHFENLGIYEMIRRRCRVIVVSDAGCDPEYTFEGLQAIEWVI
jgi:hypothetical protein